MTHEATVATPLRAKTAAGPATAASNPAPAGPSRAEDVHVALDRATAPLSRSGSTMAGKRALWAGMVTARRTAPGTAPA